MTRVLVVGSAVTDFIYQVEAFPTQAEKYRATDVVVAGGGCAGNAAVAIARLGGTAELCARMGRDLIADLTRADLEREGVDCARVVERPGGRSALSSIYVTPDGERQIMAFRGDGLAKLADFAGATPDAVLADTRWPEAALEALRLAAARGVPGVLDAEAPVPDDLVAAASHVAFSAQGLRDYTGRHDLLAGLSAAAARTAGWCCVTDGAAGVFALSGGAQSHYPTPQVTVVDTLGAGDVWHGAFALRLAEGAGEAEAVRFANAAAALKCTRPGGRSGAPTRAETDEMMQGTHQ